MRTQIEHIRQRHGYVLLWDAHSIRSEIPWLFEGRLPGLNLGTASGASAHPAIAKALDELCTGNPVTSHVLNGRFKGGFITRHYGQPASNVHVVQLEMCQDLYMREAPPWDYLPDKASRVQPLLQAMVSRALEVCKNLQQA